MAGIVNPMRMSVEAPAESARWPVGPMHHSCPCKAEVVLAGAARNDVVQDADAHVLQGLGDPVRGVGVLLGGVKYLLGAGLTASSRPLGLTRKA